ncbi:MAG: phage tail assembly chaperone [Desulfarculales bacterium]|jgi:hypothetical protein|nr:phage tail assembly chaperone [Desulfarculales bacterium]
MRYARVDNGVVLEIIEVPEGLTIGKIFPPAFVSKCVPCDADVSQGCVYDGAAFSPPPPPEPEDLASAARARRDFLLLSSDWTQLPDSQLLPDVRAAWAEYRQALRDISEQPGWPGTIDWPAEPGKGE